MAHNSIAAQPRFARWNRKGESVSDLTRDPNAQKVVTVALQRVFDPDDISKLVVRGNMSMDKDGLRMILYRGKEVWRIADYDTSYPGVVMVSAPDHDIAEVCRRDFEGLVASAWLPALNLPPDIPTGCKLSFGLNGCISIEITPCIT